MRKMHWSVVAGVAAAGMFASAAGAGVAVIGTSAARSCYESAERTSSADITSCNAALADPMLTAADRVATYVNRGILLRRGGATGAAVADFDRAIALDPGEAEAWLNKALVTVNEDDAATATASIPLFDAAIERQTLKPALAYYGRGRAKEIGGRIPDAYRDYRRAAELAPEWSLPQEDLARFRVVAPGGTATSRG